MLPNPSILALDATTEACSVALIHANDQTHFLFDVAPQQHSKIILPMIDSLLQTQQIRLQECAAVAFGQGPGSFTGLRIAAGVAQGIALAQNVPLIGISSLASLALAAKNMGATEYILAALDARMGEVYYALYRLDKNEIATVIADCLASPKAATDLLNRYLTNQTWTGIGSGVTLLQADLHTKANMLLPDAYPCAREVAILAKESYQQGAFTAIHEALPQYLRNDVVHRKKSI